MSRSHQPNYSNIYEKFKSREFIVESYKSTTGLSSIPENKGYWTLCRYQPNKKGSEINQLVDCNFLKKNQFFGIDYDIDNEGIIDLNKKEHPEANWFKGDWLEVVRDNYSFFNPAVVFFDCTRTINTKSCHIYLSKAMNMCPTNTLFVANFMLSDGHSNKKFDPNYLIDKLGDYLSRDSDWDLVNNHCYTYRSSKTDMAMYPFWRKN